MRIACRELMTQTRTNRLLPRPFTALAIATTVALLTPPPAAVAGCEVQTSTTIVRLGRGQRHGGVAVRSDCGWDARVTDGDSWIRLTTTRLGQDEGALTFDVKRLPRHSSPRTGHIEITGSGIVITVVQGEPDAFRIQRLTYNPRMERNGPSNDLSVAWDGHVEFPVFVIQTPTKCPHRWTCHPGWGRREVIEDPVQFAKFFRCWGSGTLSRPVTIGGLLTLQDATGWEDTRPIRLRCFQP